MYEEKDIEKSVEYNKIDERVGNIQNKEKIGNNALKENEQENLIEDTRAKTSFDSEKIVQERKKKILNFLKNKQIWVVGILIMAIILGVYIRSMPMQDHGGNPGLWDITTNDWTLGPDLDPWLFTRYAKTIVEQGSLPDVDMMRNVPLGGETSKETKLLPYMIAGTYYLLNIFSNTSVMFAAVIFPVIMFALTIISFFLFVREIFIRKSKKSITKANIIALISSFFMIVIPVFLSRTIAGIPEKESAAFFFMFLSFYLFLKSWKSEKIKKTLIFGFASGISTILMGLIWGGVMYLFLIISISTFIAFILNKVRKKEFILYSSWIIPTYILLSTFSGRYGIKKMAMAIDSGLAFMVFFILLIHFILWHTKLSKLKILNKYKLPKNIISLILSIILFFILVSILFGPYFIIDKAKSIHQQIFNPTIGRWNTTVAENRQPYFKEWETNFGPFIRKIPVFFWLFFSGSVVLFKKMLNKLKRKDSWILTILYVFFIFILIFSRYSSSSIFNGQNFISKFLYYFSALLLVFSFIYYYIKYHSKGYNNFENIDYCLLFLFVTFILYLFSVRGAVRLIMVLSTIVPIFVGYLIIESIDKFKKVNDEVWKIVLGVIVILILIFSIFVFWNFYKQTKYQASIMVPNAYNQQWQKTMEWVREETPTDSVFGHWWDYGYWVQSIGERATVLDGGNRATFWNYWMGRLVLTGDNQKDALEFLYNHNTTHFLIDITDIGKYGAFSSIGSDKDYDRYSWIESFLLDEKQTQETKNQTIFLYSGGVILDEDLKIEEGGEKIFLPRQNAGIGAIIVPLEGEENEKKFAQPYMVVVYQGRQYKSNLRYLATEDEFIDFGSGIEGCAYIFPRLHVQNQKVGVNPIGAIMYLSPRLMRGMLVQKYILNDPFNKFPNFKLVHSEEDLIISDLKNQGMDLPEFVYYEEIKGPIKIWEVIYTGNEELHEKYISKNHEKYLDWEL